MTSDETSADVIEFARRIMTDVYGYHFCQSFSTFQDGESEPGGFCLTHDQDRRHCREYQEATLDRLTGLIRARDALLADPADRESINLAESLTHQACAEGKHPDWFINSEHNIVCPWCRAERAEAERAVERATVMKLRGVHRRAERAEAEVARLTAERDRAREDCGLQRGLKESIREEMGGFIREALELRATVRAQPEPRAASDDQARPAHRG